MFRVQKILSHLSTKFTPDFATDLSISLSSSSNSQIELPWEKSIGVGNEDDIYLVNCTVKKSLISGAGNGRFTNEYIPKNTLILKRKFINVIKNKNEIFDEDKVILVNNLTELKILLDIYNNTFPNVTKKEIITGLSHFMASFREGKCHLNVKSHCTNHSNKNENFVAKYDENDEYLLCFSIKNIEKGSELYQNYQKMMLPQYFQDLCKQYNVMDVQTFVSCHDNCQLS